MIDRNLENILLKEAQKYPVVTITGPRQTGKTTLSRKLFPNYQYVLLEDLENQRLAKDDPKAFFHKYKGSLVLDEVQKAPELLSMIQALVDDPKNQRKFVLTGSEHLLLSEKISQSLSGRVRIFHLLSFSNQEFPTKILNERILKGGYPRIYDQDLDAFSWLSQYYATYVERDVRNVLQISDLDRFDRLVRLCAGRVGQLLDYSSLASDAGVSSPTVKSWISALKATFLCFTLEPHFKNFQKRLIKSPKLYFFDTGLLCYLLRIKTIDELETHPLYGNIFENFIISEKIKNLYHQGEESNLYFWRDQKGLEVDVVEERAGVLYPTEIKSSMTYHSSLIDNLEKFSKLQKKRIGTLIYRGDESFSVKEFQVQSWDKV